MFCPNSKFLPKPSLDEFAGGNFPKLLPDLLENELEMVASDMPVNPSPFAMQLPHIIMHPGVITDGS